MRTTIRLDEAILKAAKRLALESGRTLGETVEDLLREALARRRTSAPPPRARPLPVFRGNGLQPGVDLDDTAGLLDRMEGR